MVVVCCNSAPAVDPRAARGAATGSIPNSSSTSPAQITGVAPSRSSGFVPAESAVVLYPFVRRATRADPGRTLEKALLESSARV
jgi:hypothetical protein